MPEFPPRLRASLQNNGESWLARVFENAQQLAHVTGLKISSVNGAPLHLLEHWRGRRIGRAQSASVLTHAAIIAVFAAWAIQRPPAQTPRRPIDPAHQLTSLSPDLLRQVFSDRPSSGAGGGGNRNPLPATSGQLPALSSIQLVKPSLPPKNDPQLAVPPTILDTNAPAVLTPIADIGLPWMKDKTASA
ncbi:MAG TPA: hypothetical protein VGJ09_06400, partial [Bryobacteraceae bacterium]